MTDVVVNRDFTSFKSEMRNILVRLQLQTKKYGALDASITSKELFIVFDGHRIPGKLANETRAASRAAANIKIASDIASQATGSGPPELSKKDLNAAVGAYAVRRIGNKKKRYFQALSEALTVYSMFHQNYWIFHQNYWQW